MFLRNLTDSNETFLFANQNGVLTDQRNQPLYITSKGKAIPFKRLDICILTHVRKALGFKDVSQVERAVAKSFKELRSMISRYQNIGRFLDGSERSVLRGMKVTFETVSRAAEAVWNQRTVRPRTPDFLQYRFGAEQEIGRLLERPRYYWQVLGRKVLPSAAEREFGELSALVPRLQALGRPLTDGERDDLREKKECFEALCIPAREEWGRQEVRVRTPAWIQYEIAGTRNAIELLLQQI